MNPQEMPYNDDACAVCHKPDVSVDDSFCSNECAIRYAINALERVVTEIRAHAAAKDDVFRRRNLLNDTIQAMNDKSSSLVRQRLHAEQQVIKAAARLTPGADVGPTWEPLH